MARAVSGELVASVSISCCGMITLPSHVINAMAPADVVVIMVDEDKHTMDIAVISSNWRKPSVAMVRTCVWPLS